MNGTQTATLSEAVSAQPNGIVLVFSQYSSGSQDAHFSEFFVPKGIVTAQPGVGHVFNVWLHNVWYTCTKYLYINDTIITGHTDNAKLNYTLADTSSTGRLTADGRYFVLRYVFGV